MPVAEVTHRALVPEDTAVAAGPRKVAANDAAPKPQEPVRPAADKPATARSAQKKDTSAPAGDAPSVDAVGNGDGSAALDGRVDAIDNGRLFGWVWDRDHPAARLLVRIVLDGAEVAKGLADKPRVDLRRNGIGDGAHAFSLDLPPAALAAPERLTVIAHCEETSCELTLRRPSADERAVEAAIAAPLTRVMDRLDLLVQAQRALQLGQRDTGRALSETTQRLDAMSDSEARLQEALESVGSGQGELAVRLDQMEIFLTRFDTSLAGFDARIEAFAESSRSEIRPQFFALAVLIGMGLGLALALGLKI
ncbi:hypothetical protein V5G24_07015 [Xanthobacter sp. VTT E-85241]|uniref:hypothetical protein n=1 Tax=Roseixanthobacter finlandensis TaxID=3119922 RepID=UPI00372C1D0D